MKKNNTMNITIIGGTIESYLVCLYLLNNNKNLNINFIEINTDNYLNFSTNNITPILKECHIDILDFIKSTKSTFKVANSFEYFNHSNKCKNYFIDIPLNKNSEKFYHVLKKYFNRTDVDNDLTNRLLYPMLSLCDLNLFTEYYEPFDIYKNTSYQINYKETLKYLKNKCILFKNLNYYEAKDIEIKYFSNSVESIYFNENQLTSEFYIDCSGFDKILTKFNKNNFKSLDDIFNTDKIINLKLKYKNTSKEMLSYTNSVGLNNGWLYSVYNYDYYNINFLHNSNYENVDFDNLCSTYDIEEINELIFNSGYISNAWNENILGIGSSTYYLEPIEGNQCILLNKLLPYLSHLLNERIITDFDKEKFNLFYEDELKKEIFKIINNRHHISKRNDNLFWNYYLTKNYFEKFKTYYKEDVNNIVNSDINEFVPEIYKAINDSNEFIKNASFSYANYYQWLKNNIFEKE